MAVYIKTEREVEGIRAAGRVVAGALAVAGRAVRPGVTLKELETLCDRYVRAEGGVPTFLGYRGFPGAVCISVNEEVVHGIPDRRRLVEGDIVKIDVGVTKAGFIADAARTFAVGRVSESVRRLVQVTEEAFRRGAAAARVGLRVSDISRAIQEYVEAQGCSVVRELCGHGVGLHLHEEPSVPNFVSSGARRRLAAGMTLAVEPMVNSGKFDVRTLDNGWTVVAVDGRPSAHYENTVLVTDGEPELLTAGSLATKGKD
jgi:methionyl aminopeptidase